MTRSRNGYPTGRTRSRTAFKDVTPTPDQMRRGVNNPAARDAVIRMKPLPTGNLPAVAPPPPVVRINEEKLKNPAQLSRLERGVAAYGIRGSAAAKPIKLGAVADAAKFGLKFAKRANPYLRAASTLADALDMARLATPYAPGVGKGRMVFHGFHVVKDCPTGSDFITHQNMKLGACGLEYYPALQHTITADEAAKLGHLTEYLRTRGTNSHGDPGALISRVWERVNTDQTWSWSEGKTAPIPGSLIAPYDFALSERIVGGQGQPSVSTDTGVGAKAAPHPVTAPFSRTSDAPASKTDTQPVWAGSKDPGVHTPTATEPKSKPTKGMKENKARVPRAVALLMRTVFAYSEVQDVMEAAYKALPKNRRKCRPKDRACQWKQTIAHHEEVNTDDFLRNVVANAIEDAIIGRADGAVAKALRNHGIFVEGDKNVALRNPEAQKAFGKSVSKASDAAADVIWKMLGRD